MSIFGWSYPAGCSGPPDEPGCPIRCCVPETCVCGKPNWDEARKRCVEAIAEARD